MAKFVNSSDSISSALLLWNDRPTQVAIQETYDLKVWPVTNILNDGPIHFNVPPQMKGMMTDINIVTRFKIQENGADITESQNSLSIVNNFASSLWGYVDVQVDDRQDLMQSMRNAYAYQTFFNTTLNSSKDRADYLLYNELFKMDEGISKDFEEHDKGKRVFWQYDLLREYIIESAIETGLGLTGEALTAKKLEFRTKHLEANPNFWTYVNTNNPAAGIRSQRIKDGKSVTLSSKLQCPLFNTSKCLPTKMRIRISLTKNNDEFLLLTNDDTHYSIFLEDIYLQVTYYRPRDEILEMLEDRLKKDPAPYFISKPEIIIRPISNAGRIIRMTDIFHDKLPPYAFFCLQKSADFEGKLKTNPFVFIPFKKFQFYVDGTPYFNDPLEVVSIESFENEGRSTVLYKDFGDYLRQLYQTIGRDMKGDCLIDSSNFSLNFMVGMSFGADRSSTNDKHLNLQESASTYLEIDLGINEVPSDMVLICYAVYDRQIQIDVDRRVRIIE